MTDRSNSNDVAQPGQPPPKRRVVGYVRSATTPNEESIQNQIDAIGSYSDKHGMQVVRIYRDEGRSGLRIDDRPGLQQMFRDVENGAADFDAVLVLDSTRWGRFLDAHWIVTDEFGRRNADIEILYCADRCADAESPFSSIVKSLKRAMAHEYEHELSCRKRPGAGAAARRIAARSDGSVSAGPAEETGARSDAPLSVQKRAALR